ncbi:hypothetical protein PGT21_006124 [Puccinia graminis f. sp. tritici]|uniref:Uncharacterized protein n=1 Tax=Puccinia graminis f. sp. tritici TaxID=56615 RepID=A0A5B0ND50_PUCGR|nr:hypothetical protein PGT21_006124 [Puccinia graminis f. sp. tritici]
MPSRDCPDSRVDVPFCFFAEGQETGRPAHIGTAECLRSKSIATRVFVDYGASFPFEKSFEKWKEQTDSFHLSTAPRQEICVCILVAKESEENCLIVLDGGYHIRKCTVTGCNIAPNNYRFITSTWWQMRWNFASRHIWDLETPCSILVVLL